MGYYIQAPTNRNKAQYLINKHGAELCKSEPEWREDKAIICVVDNGAFEAAAYAYSARELEEFKYPDRGVQRKRTWLLMDKTLAQKLSGFSRFKERS